MYAIKYDGPRKVQCVEIDKPQAGENEALIKDWLHIRVSSVMRWQGKSCPYQSTIKRA